MDDIVTVTPVSFAASAAGLHAVDETELAEKLASLSIEQKASLLSGSGPWSLTAIPEIGLRQIVVSDGPNGVRGPTWDDERNPSALLPNVSAMAASWDEALLEKVGRILAGEAICKGVDVILGPGVNLHRTPLGGRNFEYFSEDPLLTTRLATAYIRGVQSQGLGTCVKHFVLNETETQRFSYNVEVDERTRREMYYLPFEAAAKAGATSLMSSYNSVDGKRMTTNAALNTDVLKGEWEYDGALISDWTAVRDGLGSMLGGLDLAMPGPDKALSHIIIKGVREGSIPEAVIDDHVLRILRLAARVGGFAPAREPNENHFARPEDVRKVAARSVTLLKNEPVDGKALLPLTGSSIAVIGPAATMPAYQGGGSASVYPAYTVSPLDALRTAIDANVKIDFAQGLFSRRLLPRIDTDLFSDPVSGAPGLRLTCLSGDGTVLLEELRTNSSFVFHPSFNRAIPAGTSEIRLSTRLRANKSGEHSFGVVGTGLTHLQLGSAEPETIELKNAVVLEDFRELEQVIKRVHLNAGETLDVIMSRPVPEFEPWLHLGLGYLAPVPDSNAMLAEAVRLAESADSVLLFLGNTDETETEQFDRGSLLLPGQQNELAELILAANPRTVVVVNAASPVLMPWIDRAAAVLWTGFGGQEYGNAVADILLGRVEPVGRLPTTFPARPEDAPVLDTQPVNGQMKYAEGSLVGYRGYDAAGIEPLFPFGHGLGYSNWAYESVSVRINPEADPADLNSVAAIVSVGVKNISERSGREVVQIYAEALVEDLGAPPRTLVGFELVEAAAGEKVAVQIPITARALSRYIDGTWVLPSQERKLVVARSSRDDKLTAWYQPVD